MFYDEVGSSLSLSINEDKVYFVNKQQKKYDIKKKVLYDKTFKVDESIEMYKSYIVNCKYDRSIGRIIKTCNKCNHNLFNYLVLSGDKVYIYICNNCNNVTSDAITI